MKKRVITVLLGMALAMSCAIPAMAAQMPFADVKVDSWYCKDVENAYAMGLIQGKSATSFAPNDNMTYAEAVKLASCMHQKYVTGAVTLGNGKPWYQSYVEYAKANGIIERAYIWNNNASRAEYAKIFAHALPDAALKEINSIEDNSIPDVKADHPQAPEIYKLYRAGVLTGNDTYGTFAPDSEIKRSEVSAVLTRMMDVSARKGLTLKAGTVPPAVRPPVIAPVNVSVKYIGGGADSKYYVQEGSAGSPWYGDLDRDGKGEIIWASRSIFCLDAKTGKTKWRVDSGSDRNHNNGAFGVNAIDVQVLDIDKDGRMELVTAHNNFGSGKGCLAVYDDMGNFKPGWPKTMDFSIRALNVSDLDKDGYFEIIVGLGIGHAGWGENGAPALHIFEPDGSNRDGWPKNCDYGLYANSVTTTDMDGDGMAEVILTYDGEHPRAFHADGNEVIATGGIYAGLSWNHLLVAENYAHEEKCVEFARNHGGAVWASGKTILGPDRKDSYAFMGSSGGVAAADVDNNGRTELVFTGMIVNGNTLMDGKTDYSEVAKYCTTFILNLDRTRYQNTSKGFDWTQFPTDPGKLISVDYNLIVNADMTPVVIDVNGDGNKEILYAANDGYVHCWNLNKQESGNWPFQVCAPNDSVKKCASQPVCMDLNGDRMPEIVFTTYTQKGPTAERGKLFVLDFNGNMLVNETLPLNYSEASLSVGSNGSMAKPCVGDFDGDGKYEIALTTLFSGLTVYDVG